MVALVGINLLYSYIIHSPLKLRASSRNIGSSSTGEYIDTAGELSDEEYAEVLAFAAGGDEAQEKEELNLKVKQAMEKEWDLKVDSTHFYILVFCLHYPLNSLCLLI